MKEQSQAPEHEVQQIINELLEMFVEGMNTQSDVRNISQLI